MKQAQWTLVGGLKLGNDFSDKARSEIILRESGIMFKARGISSDELDKVLMSAKVVPRFA